MRSHWISSFPFWHETLSTSNFTRRMMMATKDDALQLGIEENWNSLSSSFHSLLCSLCIIIYHSIHPPVPLADEIWTHNWSERGEEEKRDDEMNLHQQVIEPEEQHAKPDEKKSKCVKSSRRDDLRRVSDSRFHWSGCTKRKWWSDRHDWWLFLSLSFFSSLYSSLFALVYPSVSGLCLCKHWQSQSLVCTHTTGEQTCSSWALNMMKIFSRAKVDRLFFTLPSSCQHSLYRWHCRNFPSSRSKRAHKKKSLNPQDDSFSLNNQD